MRVFLDANILFSGAQSHSRMRAFLSLLMSHAECATSPYAVEEARRNLERKFPSALPRLSILVDHCVLTDAVASNTGVALKEKDMPILGGAVASKSTHLLTGDERDFGAFFGNTILAVKIVSPRLLAEELEKLGVL